jgi:hypothetical protein
VAAALAAEPDHRESDILIGTRGTEPQGGEGEGGAGGRAAEEITAE